LAGIGGDVLSALVQRLTKALGDGAELIAGAILIRGTGFFI
jgi:hypothetical protein